LLDSVTYADGEPNSYSDCNRNGDRHSHGNCYSYSDSHCDADLRAACGSERTNRNQSELQ
jgi:hypothetical protein